MKWHKTFDVLPNKNKPILIYDMWVDDFSVVRYDTQTNTWKLQNGENISPTGFTMWAYLEVPKYGN